MRIFRCKNIAENQGRYKPGTLVVGTRRNNDPFSLIAINGDPSARSPLRFVDITDEVKNKKLFRLILE